MEQRTDEVFPFGEGTLMHLREQPWALDQDDPGSQTIAFSPAMTAAVEPTAAPLTLEQKVDELLRAVHAIQRRLDSMDAFLAKYVAK